LLRSIIVERDVAGIEKTFEAFPASGHVIDRSAEVVFGTQRGELLIHPVLEFVEQRPRMQLALCVTRVVGEFAQFVFDIEQPSEASHRGGSLFGRAERMLFLELAACMRMAARNPNSALGIGTQQFVADVAITSCEMSWDTCRRISMTRQSP
jgi:hypothetical protein